MEEKNDSRFQSLLHQVSGANIEHGMAAMLYQGVFQSLLHQVSGANGDTEPVAAEASG